MIVLGTNVVSEAIRPQPDANVLAWLNAQAAETLYISSVTLADLLFGISALPDGKRKAVLGRTLDGVMGLFENRVLPFDAQAASHYAELAGTARNNRRGFPTLDGYIAAIAASRGFLVASRDTTPFEAAGMTVINPWERPNTGQK